jgi:hypothetical protein
LQLLPYAAISDLNLRAVAVDLYLYSHSLPNGALDIQVAADRAVDLRR